MDKHILTLFLTILILCNLVAVSAITGSIGNARMVLRADAGDKIEKYILVKNVNEVPVNIEISVSGDLADYVDIKDEKFTLQAGEEKKAYFTINVKKEGTTETKINVQFTPQEGKNGVGLSSTVIVIAGEEGSSDVEDCNGQCDIENNQKTTNILTGKATQENSIKISPLVTVLLIMTAIIAVIFIILLIIAFRKTKNKRKIKLKKRSGKR